MDNYFAEGESYHCISTRLPTCATRGSSATRLTVAEFRSITLPGATSQDAVKRVLDPHNSLALRNQVTIPLRIEDLPLKHTPVQSPLLRESSLCSRPPLNYMLKFGGLPTLSSCTELNTMPLYHKNSSNRSASLKRSQ